MTKSEQVTSGAAPSAVAHDHRPPFQRSFLRPRYWGTWCLLALLRVAVWLPRPLAAFIGARLGDAFRLLNAKRRRVAEVNVALCFPELSPAARAALVRRHFRAYMQCLLDSGLLWWASPVYLARYMRVRGLEHCRAAQAAGRPIVVLTGHFAALEIGGVMLSRELPMAAFIKPAKNRVVDWFMTRGRRRFRAAANVFLREQGLRPVVRALKAGSALYYLPDEDFGPERSVFLPFLGTEAATITALPRLAKLAGAAVIPCFTRRLSARAGYEIVLEPPLDNFPSGDDLADARRMNQVLERAVRAAPEQYMWTLKLFRTRPGGAPSPYG